MISNYWHDQVCTTLLSFEDSLYEIITLLKNIFDIKEITYLLFL